MKILVGIKRAVDYNVRIRVRSDGSGVETDGVKMSINPFDEIAVEQAIRIARYIFQRVAERVAQVQKRAVPLFGLIAHDDIGLHLYGHAHRLDPRVHVACGQRWPMLFEPIKEGRVAQETVFHDLAIAREEIARGERG